MEIEREILRTVVLSEAAAAIGSYFSRPPGLAGVLTGSAFLLTRYATDFFKKEKQTIFEEILNLTLPYCYYKISNHFWIEFQEYNADFCLQGIFLAYSVARLAQDVLGHFLYPSTTSEVKTAPPLWKDLGYVVTAAVGGIMVSHNSTHSILYGAVLGGMALLEKIFVKSSHFLKSVSQNPWAKKIVEDITCGAAAIFFIKAEIFDSMRTGIPFRSRGKYVEVYTLNKIFWNSVAMSLS